MMQIPPRAQENLVTLAPQPSTVLLLQQFAIKRVYVPHVKLVLVNVPVVELVLIVQQKSGVVVVQLQNRRMIMRIATMKSNLVYVLLLRIGT